jgi:hypothetical protein
MKKGKSHTTSQNAKCKAHTQARQRPGKSHHYDHSDYDTPQSED